MAINFRLFLIFTYYSRIMLDALYSLLFSLLCRHNSPRPSEKLEKQTIQATKRKGGSPVNTAATPSSNQPFSSNLEYRRTTLLSKGLSFCPTPPWMDEGQLQCDLKSYLRRLRLREYFLDQEEEGEHDPFRNLSTWQPDKDRD